MAGGLCVGAQGFSCPVPPATRNRRLPLRFPATALGGFSRYSVDQIFMTLGQVSLCGCWEPKHPSSARTKIMCTVD